jgi:hypothetical protein
MLTSRKMKSKKNEKYLIIFSILIVAALLFFLGLFFYKNNSRKQKTTEILPTINYEPATDEEKKQAEDTKNKIVKQQEAQQDKPTSPSAQKTSVKPTITSTTGSVNAYVNGIFEEGGVCTATFTKNESVLSKTSAGFQNASYTQCAPMNLESGFLSSGRWSVTVRYSSDTSEGTSESQIIEVNN